MGDDQIIFVGGALLAAALGSSVLAARLRVPSVLLFLVVGMAVGSDGAGWLSFGDYDAARRIGSIALALILFEGGLSAGLAEIRPVLGAAWRLGLLGTLLTALIAGFGAALLFGLPLLYGLLLGSVLASTDTAAVFGLLRGTRLERRLGRTLEGEAGLNDPVAILLVVGFISWIQVPGYGAGDLAVLFVKELTIGTLSGVCFGAAGAAFLRHVRLEPAGLYPVASTAVAALAFGGAQSLGGSGFLAVYLAGLALGGRTVPDGRVLRVFHGGVAWLAQVTLFLVLGLLVNPGELGAVAGEGIALAALILLVARPVAVMVVTASEGFSVNERLVLAWAGLRGAVPVVLATLPVIAGVPGAERIFDVVFFTVVISTLVQGTTFAGLARRLGLTASAQPDRNARAASSGPIAPLVTQLWTAADEDPRDPAFVAGVAVSERLCTREGVAGALVVLSDGRYAVTGPTMTVGSARQIERFAQRHVDTAADGADVRWWRLVLRSTRLPARARSG